MTDTVDPRDMICSEGVLVGVAEFGQQVESSLLFGHLERFDSVCTVDLQNGRHEEVGDSEKFAAGECEDQVAVVDNPVAQSGYGCDARDSRGAVRVWARIE